MIDLISRQAAIDALNVLCQEHRYRIPGKRETYSQYNEAWQDALDRAEGAIGNLPSAQPGCEDAVPRTSVEYICRKNTVSTNPYEHKYHDKFIQFMDDPEISDFGRWQHSNGFNTALVAVKCDLDKVPPVTPKQPGWIPCSTALPSKYDNYLITTEDGMVVFGVYDPREKQWCRYDSIKSWWIYGIRVLAWMPLPTPYREGGQDGTD